MTHQRSEAITRQHEEFVRLFRESSPWLFNYLISLLRDAEDAEDALQETVYVCWEKFDQYDASIEFRAWARGIAYHKAMDTFKRRRKQGVLCSERFFETISGKAVAMAKYLENRSDAVKLCVKRLPEKDRDLIEQRYTFDASVQELAEGSGRSIHAIYRALRRIHDMLLRCIKRAIAE